MLRIISRKATDSDMIYHVYWGTDGNAGLYLDEIYQCLYSNGFRQKIFVSHFFPFNYGKKIFFRFTDYGHLHQYPKIRALIRFIELVYGLMYVLLYVFYYKPKIINLSLTGTFFPVTCFLSLIKKCSSCTLVLTCHDVIPHESVYQSFDKQVRIRKKCFNYADYLLVHSDNSVNDLKNIFDIEIERVLFHPFPIMDLRKLFSSDFKINKQYDFLFLGNLRKEKGIEVLLEAWRLFHNDHNQSTLCIAGNNPFDINLNTYKDLNVYSILHFLSDEQYYNLACSAKCIILPYTSGTNSGVVYTLISLGSCIITSDLEMFKSNPLLDVNNMFETNNPYSLKEKMEKMLSSDFICNHQHENLLSYKSSFDHKVKSIYSMLVNNKN